LTIWAQGILTLKNQLTTSDAQEVESAFAVKLHELGEDVAAPDPPESATRIENGGDSNSELTAAGSDGSGRQPTAAAEKSNPAPKLNGNRVPRRRAAGQNGSSDGATSEAAIQQPVTPLSKPLRMRDRDHLRFVTTQPCLACGRLPSDAHHLKFAEQRAMGRKVSDEYTVPLCRVHHREVHRRGDERVWWQHLNIDPLQAAQRLWERTQLNAQTLDLRSQSVAGE
jgi:hypothetical protein